MKKSEIEAIPFCPREGKAVWYVDCKEVKLSDQNAMLIDIWHKKEKVVRYVIGTSQCMTYIASQKRWSKAKIIRSDYEENWPTFEEYINSKARAAGIEANIIVSPNVSVKYGSKWIRGIYRQQEDIENERKQKNCEIKAFESRKTAGMMPVMSERFKKFVREAWNDSIIWTHEQDNRTFLTCSYCGKRDVVNGSLKKSKKIRCAYCDKAGRREKETSYESIIEKKAYYNDVRPYQTGIAIIAVRVTRTEQMAMPVRYDFEEVAAMIFKPGRKTPDEYWIYGDRWDKGVKYEDFYGTGHRTRSFPTGPTPGYASKVLSESRLKYTGWEYYGAELYKYLRAWQQEPKIELLAKAGLKKLITYKLNEAAYSALTIGLKASSFADIFGILPERRKMLIDSEGDPEMLKILQMERSIGRMQDRTIELIRDMSSYDRKNIQDISQWVSPDKAVKYLASQTQTEDNHITLYADYLKMRNDMHYPMKERLFPRDLIAAHDELVDERDKEVREKRIIKYEAEYTAIRANYKKLYRRYKYEDSGYIIRPAKSCKEIVEEGAALHHCVGVSNTYISRHNSGSSYILFMRKKEAKDRPFCTIEINADNTIAQWYEAYDKKPDEAILQPILNRYVEHLKERETI